MGGKGAQGDAKVLGKSVWEAAHGERAQGCWLTATEHELAVCPGGQEGQSWPVSAIVWPAGPGQ